MKTWKRTACGTLWAGVVCTVLGCGGAAETDSSADSDEGMTPAAEVVGEAETAELSASATAPTETETAVSTADTPVTQEAVELKIVDKAGYDAVIAAQQGKVVLVDFWATWCIPCQKKFPETVAWSQKFGPKGLAVVSMSMDEADDDTQARVRKFLAKHNATFTNLLSGLGGDEEGMMAFDIDGGALPHYKLYGRDGKLLQKFGEGDPDKPLKSSDIEVAIEQALAAE